MACLYNELIDNTSRLGGRALQNNKLLKGSSTFAHQRCVLFGDNLFFAHTKQKRHVVRDVFVVGGQGFEPWKAYASRFTVCPV